MKKYDTYKDSGIEWLGEIPEHWKAIKLKHLAQVRTGYTPPKINDENYCENGVIWVKPENLKEFTPIVDSKEKISEEGLRNNSIIPKGSVLVCCIGSIGKFGVAGVDLITNQQINSLIFNDKVNIEYGKFLIAASQSEHDRNSNGNVVKILNGENQKNIFLVYPPLTEQIKIASFLNHKTTQIDTLIEKKEQLVEKLTLKRQAIINEAVTKGLNPDVPMKDSGIEWLGEIPEHWEVVKFRHLIDILTDFTANGSFGDLAKNVTYIEEGYSRLIRLTDLRVDLLNKGVYLSEESHNYLSKSELFGGEVLLANVGAYSGLAWLMPYNVGKASLGPNMLLLKFKDQLDNKYAYHAMISKYLSSQFKLKAISAAQPKINKEDVRSCIFILPPKREQMEINIYLDSKDLIYNSVSEKLEIQIAKLKLYRQSLISEAVTGKIDLRDWEQTDNK